VAKLRQDLGERGGRVDPERVGTSGAADRLDDRGIAGLVERAANIVDRPRPR
jgi:hypothetical protein